MALASLQSTLFLSLLLTSPVLGLIASKTDWRVGGVSQHGGTFYEKHFDTTFEDYMKNYTDLHFSPPLNWSNSGVHDSHQLHDLIKNKTFDFVFLTAEQFTCYELEFRLYGVATVRILRKGIELSHTGGILFVRNDSNITTLEDVKGKILASDEASVNGPLSDTFTSNKMNLHTTVGMLMETYEQDTAVFHVRNKTADVGFVDSETIEVLEHEGLLNESEFRVIHQYNTSQDDGTTYPFPVSTPLYPEPVLAALPHVDHIVAEEVARALLELTPNDTASKVGFYVRWQPSLSYVEMHRMQRSAGFLDRDPNTFKENCRRTPSVYDDITCGAGFVKRTLEESQRCLLNRSCPQETNCFCGVCRAAPDVEVLLSGCFNSSSCEKMQICHTMEQRAQVTFYVHDNLNRDSNMTYIFHGTPVDGFSKSGILNGSDSDYNFTISTPLVGEFVIELFVSGVQIDNSPFTINVLERSCEQDYKANKDGLCQLAHDTKYLPDEIHYFADIMFGINVALALAFGGWTFWTRKTKVVMASQPEFLYIVCLGCVISSVSILLISFDDRDYSKEHLDSLCQATVWFYGIGFTLSVTALMAKTLRSKRIMLDGLKKKKSKLGKATVLEFIGFMGKCLLVELIFLSIWTAISPLTWQRTCRKDSDEEFCTSIGHCASTDAIPFLAIMLFAHLVALIYQCYLCYRVRHVPAEFSEHKWITAATISSIEILLACPFLVLLSWEDSVTSTIILTCSLFLNDLGILLMIFVPKIGMTYATTDEEKLTVEDMLHNLRREVRSGPKERKDGIPLAPIKKRQTVGNLRKKVLPEGVDMKIVSSNNSANSKGSAASSGNFGRPNSENYTTSSIRNPRSSKQVVPKLVVGSGAEVSDMSSVSANNRNEEVSSTIPRPSVQSGLNPMAVSVLEDNPSSQS